MEKCSGSTPPKSESDVGAGVNKAAPPQVITVDTSSNKLDGDKSSLAAEGTATTARTPKHTNKTTGGVPNAGRAPQHGQGGIPRNGGFYPPYDGRPVGGNGAFQPHDSRRQPPPHSLPADHYYNQSPPMHVSPGGAGASAAAYDRRGHNGGPYYSRRGPGGYPPHGPPPGYYDQRGGYNDYGPPPHMSRPPSHPSGQRYDGNPQHMRGQHQYPPQPYPTQSYNSYPADPRNGPSYSGGPSPNYPPGAGQYPPGRGPDQHYPRESHGYPPIDHHHGANNTPFSRSVSTSFDRSVKEKPMRTSKRLETNQESQRKKPSATDDREQRQDGFMASDDASWKQLNQVHSVDDNAIQEHLGMKKGGAKQTVKQEETPSNSSSLTNSPTDGSTRQANLAASIAAAAAAAVAATKTEPIRKTSSLDELSSVTSPHDRSNKKRSSSDVQAPGSPGIVDSDSLDLMKCSSDGSGLLNLVPSKGGEGLLYEDKHGEVEERGDKGESAKGGDELRRAPSDLEEKQPRKKVKIESNAMSKMEKSPLSITCSPSAAMNKKGSSTRKAPTSHNSTIDKSDYHVSPNLGENSLYDKPPAYSYSMDSAPPIPRGSGQNKQSANPTLPPRPTSSSSSTLTPGQIHMDNPDHTNAVVSSIPSWEINAVDSFGGGSVGGGHGLSNNFSFQDYPMLPASESNLGNPGGDNRPPLHSHPTPNLPPHPTMSPGQTYGNMHNHRMNHHAQNHPPIESRNQSFDGGHYHGGGSFHRTESMDIGYGRGPAPGYHDSGYKHGHQGPFPPHAPSWGTAGSAQSHPSYQQQHPPYMGNRMDNYPPVMRNYSQDSGHRASPPPGPSGPHGRHYMHRPPQNFQPPPDFVAPHNPHLTRRPPPAVYIMSSQGVSHPNAKRGTGVFSWSKEDDTRLTEIMKKYKNPRDWEPIAKEHGMGKTAKDCHERWIRYLKPGVRKGQWTDQEDSIVIDAVQNSSEQPFTRWSDLAQRLPGRVGKQIRDRWVNHLNPNINHLPFSREDDLLLWEGHKKLGKRWVEISTKSFNSTRSENHIKNRWYSASFKKFIANEFGPDAYSGGKSKGKDDKSKTKMKKIDDDPATKPVGR
mmetsp:Transcript_1095/g.2805  ORF Transcript_1095/g.2805 Transcript_1095/m.2805 type:complete len:1092 (+) Transcript_1095:257-3532(+)